MKNEESFEEDYYDSVDKKTKKRRVIRKKIITTF